MTAMRRRARADKKMDILSMREVCLKKGSFYCVDLLISSFSIIPLAVQKRQLPLRTNPLNSSSLITPSRYFVFSLYWLVLNPYVLVRQGITTQDSLVVGISLLFRMSLYLSGRGKNYYFISSCTPFCVLFIKFYRKYNHEIPITFIMGQSQSSVDKYLSQARQFKPIPTKTGPLASLPSLLSQAERQTISETQLRLTTKSKDTYIVRSRQKMTQLLQFEGEVRIFRVDQDKEEKTEVRLFEGAVKKMQRNGFGVQYSNDQSQVYRGFFVHDLYQGWGQNPHYSGQFKQGKRHGFGVYLDTPNKIRYQGLFHKDLFHGIGYLNVTEAQVKIFLQQNTFLNNPNYSVQYVGEWRQGKMNGKGKLTTVSSVYTGGFEDGMFEGEGKLISTTAKLEGKFYKGKFM